ncbi:hypothetical protein [Embleya hyalina]|uniref:Uncharacterized protein n=1 Tax=Embleya hyalina TaxID=516124 RepID=A0A401YSM5_9ACTN|nr:hypothetical protein [Embleya hyalina]GCD97594.1 hypothetical protein EHYA_05289 [Embleya hyalina]
MTGPEEAPEHDVRALLVGWALFLGTVLLVVVDCTVVLAGYWNATNDCMERWGCREPTVGPADGSLVAFGTSLLALLLATLSMALPGWTLRAVRRWLGLVTVAGQVIGIVVVVDATG